MTPERLPATFRRHLGNALGTPQGQTGGMGTLAARSWHRRRHGGGTPRVEAGGVDTSIEARTRAAHANHRGRVPPRFQTGNMGPPTRSPGDASVTACCGSTVAALAFHERSKSVPEGGRTGGNQTSAPQVRPHALPDTAAPSRGHDGGTVVAPDTFGPTAHLINLVLLVLLYGCSARPNWISQ